MKKQILFLTALLSILFLTFGCLKDEIAKDKIQEVTYTDTKEPVKTEYFIQIFPEQFDGLFGKFARDGAQFAFSHPGSMVDFNPFTNTVTAFNIRLIDSARYDRLDIFQQYFYANMSWGKYHRKIYMQNNIVAIDVVFAPINGNTYYVFPNIINNQMDASNPNYSVTLIRQSKSESYYDHKCGKNKKKFWYTIITGDVNTQSTIDGDRCMSNVFSYKLIL